MISILAALVILLVAVISSFRNQLGERVLVTVSAPTYDSPLVTPLEFVQQDLERIRSASGIQLTHLEGQSQLSNFSTEEELSDLIQEVLPEVRQDTLIVFVRLHAVTDDDDGELYLLPSDVDPLAQVLPAATLHEFRQHRLQRDAVQRVVRLLVGHAQLRPGRRRRRAPRESACP